MQVCPRLQRRARPGFTPDSLFIRYIIIYMQRTPENRKQFSQEKQGSQERNLIPLSNELRGLPEESARACGKE